MFKTLARQETLVSKLTAQVERLITENQLPPGSRLPAERELAGQFGVSRTVVREAVRTLVAQGLLEVLPGSGTLVRVPSAEVVTRSISLFLRGGRPELDPQKVMEIRRLLEVEIAGLAAARRTADDLAFLEQNLNRQDGISADREQFVTWDVGFHGALAAATHNELFSLLLDSVIATMRQVRELGFHIPTTPANAIRHHTAILDCVKAGRAAAARQAMQEHLDEAEETMKRAWHLASADSLRKANDE